MGFSMTADHEYGVILSQLERHAHVHVMEGCLDQIRDEPVQCIVDLHFQLEAIGGLSQQN